MIDLRVVRLVASLAFLAITTAIAIAGQINWPIILADLGFLIMSMLMWWPDLQAQADLRADRQRAEEKARLDRVRGQHGTGQTVQMPPGPNTGQTWPGNF